MIAPPPTMVCVINRQNGKNAILRKGSPRSGRRRGKPIITGRWLPLVTVMGASGGKCAAASRSNAAKGRRINRLFRPFCLKPSSSPSYGVTLAFALFFLTFSLSFSISRYFLLIFLASPATPLFLRSGCGEDQFSTSARYNHKQSISAYESLY